MQDLGLCTFNLEMWRFQLSTCTSGTFDLETRNSDFTKSMTSNEHGGTQEDVHS